MYNRDNNGKVTITCKKHGDFKVLPSNFLLKRSGCPNCYFSKLEDDVSKFLDENNIIYEREKTFEWLKNKNSMFLDFYLPDYNIAIECQGLQHFKPIQHFGGEEGYKKRKKLDLLKKELCEKHFIKILYYTNEKINENIITNKEELLRNIS